MRLPAKRPAISAVPTITDGAPPGREVQKKVIQNQVRTDLAWSETDQDLAVNNLINEREEIRDTRWQIIALALIAVILFVFGSIWTYNSIQRDRVLASERAAAEKVRTLPPGAAATPY